MMPRQIAICVVLTLVTGCSCAMDHVVPMDAYRPDGGPGTACESLTVPPLFAVPCSGGPEACPSYRQGLVADGDRAESVECLDHACAPADHCFDTIEGRQCVCGTSRCSGICVRHPDETVECVSACLRERTPDRVCASLSPPVPEVTLDLRTVCDDDAAHACRLWAQSMAPPRTHALGTCAMLMLNVVCTAGDGVGGAAAVTCGDTTCAPTELCVVDELPDGSIDPASSAHCVPACWAP